MTGPPPLTGIRVIEFAGLAPGTSSQVTLFCHWMLIYSLQDRLQAFCLLIVVLLFCGSIVRLPTKHTPRNCPSLRLTF
jgi:hypothetical protein